MGVVEEFVDRPLVVRVLSVLESSDPPVGSDQEIRRQPEATSGGLDRSERAALRTAVPERGGLTGDRRAQRARAQQRARSALDAEPPVQRRCRRLRASVLPWWLGQHGLFGPHWWRQLIRDWTGQSMLRLDSVHDGRAENRARQGYA